MERIYDKIVQKTSPTFKESHLTDSEYHSYVKQYIKSGMTTKRHKSVSGVGSEI